MTFCVLVFQILSLFPFDDIHISGRSVVGVNFWTGWQSGGLLQLEPVLERLYLSWSFHELVHLILVHSDLICIYILSRQVCVPYKSSFPLKKRVILLTESYLVFLSYWLKYSAFFCMHLKGFYLATKVTSLWVPNLLSTFTKMIKLLKIYLFVTPAQF